MDYRGLIIVATLLLLSDLFPFSDQFERLLHSLYHNDPNLKGDSLIINSLQSKAGSIGWKDPKVGGGYFISPIETRLGSQLGKVGVSQSLPKYGELKLQRDRVDIEKRIKEIQLIQRREHLHKSLIDLWIDGEIKRDIITIKLSILEDKKELSNYMKSGVESGEMDLTHIYKVEDQILKLKEDINTLKLNLKTIKSKISLTTYTNEFIEFGSQLTTPDTLLEIPETEGWNYIISNLYSRLNLVDLKQTKLQYQPSITLGGEYIFIGADDYVIAKDKGSDAIALTASISLPIWGGTKDSKVENRAKYYQSTLASAMSEKDLLVLNRVQLKDKFYTLHISRATLEDRINNSLEIEDIYSSKLGSGVGLKLLLEQRIRRKIFSIEKLMIKQNILSTYLNYYHLIRGGDLYFKKLYSKQINRL